jgi:hypothetical protein
MIFSGLSRNRQDQNVIIPAAAFTFSSMRGQSVGCQLNNAKGEHSTNLVTLRPGFVDNRVSSIGVGKGPRDAYRGLKRRPDWPDRARRPAGKKLQKT